MERNVANAIRISPVTASGQKLFDLPSLLEYIHKLTNSGNGFDVGIYLDKYKSQGTIHPAVQMISFYSTF